MSERLNSKFLEAVLFNDIERINGLLKDKDKEQNFELLLMIAISADNYEVADKILTLCSEDILYKAASFVTSFRMLKLLFEKGLNIENLLNLNCSEKSLNRLLWLTNDITKTENLELLDGYYDLPFFANIKRVISSIKDKPSQIAALILIVFNLYKLNRHKFLQYQKSSDYLIVELLCSNCACFREEILNLIKEPVWFSTLKNYIKRRVEEEKQNVICEIRNILEENSNIKNELFKDLLLYVRDAKTAKILLDAGASIDTRNASGETPLELIQRNSSYYSEPEKTIELLKSAYTENHPEDNLRFKTLDIKLEDITPLIEMDHFKISYKNSEYFVGQSFVNSMSKAFGFNPNFFKYFSPEEIFERLIYQNGDKHFFLTFDEKEKVALSVLNSDKLFLPASYTINMIEKHKLFINSFYHQGIYYAEMLLREDGNDFSVGDSIFESRILICYAVDGSCSTMVYPGFSKKGSNTLIYIMDKSFSTELVINKVRSGHSFADFLNSHNLYPFSVARQCFINALTVPASVNECLNMLKMLSSSLKDDLAVHKLNDSFEQYIGDPCEYYGITSLKKIKPNIRHMLPVRCSVMDIILYAAELASHSTLKMVNFFEIYKHIGKLMSTSYDLEKIFPLQKN